MIDLDGKSDKPLPSGLIFSTGVLVLKKKHQDSVIQTLPNLQHPAASSLSATGSIFVMLEYAYNYLGISHHWWIPSKLLALVVFSLKNTFILLVSPFKTQYSHYPIQSFMWSSVKENLTTTASDPSIKQPKWNHIQGI